uniref:Uncharacterized protein n=1 Tax=Tupiella akineta TaxID=160070 RepID=Q3ZJ35_TUPAK|nr:hypothetical protein PsakCp058 [Tupiella akineta]AAV80654.1 hypothetical protein [Tupiella akineta]
MTNNYIRRPFIPLFKSCKRKSGPQIETKTGTCVPNTKINCFIDLERRGLSSMDNLIIPSSKEAQEKRSEIPSTTNQNGSGLTKIDLISFNDLKKMLDLIEGDSYLKSRKKVALILLFFTDIRLPLLTRLTPDILFNWLVREIDNFSERVKFYPQIKKIFSEYKESICQANLKEKNTAGLELNIEQSDFIYLQLTQRFNEAYLTTVEEQEFFIENFYHFTVLLKDKTLTLPIFTTNRIKDKPISSVALTKDLKNVFQKTSKILNKSIKLASFINAYQNEKLKLVKATLPKLKPDFREDDFRGDLEEAINPYLPNKLHTDGPNVLEIVEIFDKYYNKPQISEIMAALSLFVINPSYISFLRRGIRH